MYEFTTTERNNEKASEYETKSLLYLFGCRDDSEEIELFIIDCFNDVSGSDKEVRKLWDVQSKGVKSLNPRKIGRSLVTLFQNYVSEIAFEFFIFFMPKLKEMYLYDEDSQCFSIINFKNEYIEKIKLGLREEYCRRNTEIPSETDIDNFLNLVQFVIAKDGCREYIENIISFRNAQKLENEFYNRLFEEIRNAQTIAKTKNVNGCQIMNAAEVMQFKKYIWKKDIDAMVINRMLGIDLFNSKMVPIAFIDEISMLNVEERKDIIQDCQSDIARLLFDKNGRVVFWRFFEKILMCIQDNSKLLPSEIFEEIKKSRIKIPRFLKKKSVIYLISVLKEGLENEN